MKKKFIFTLLILLFTTSLECFSQNFNLKSYDDYKQGFSGAAGAIFIGNLEDQETKDFLDYFLDEIPDTATTVSKLTKNNMWLCKQALNEWDYEKGEVYLVFCAESRWADDCILLIVKINGKDDFDWFGVYLSESDLEQMGN